MLSHVCFGACARQWPITCAGGRVTLSSGIAVDYDWLVLALGSETNTFGVPGAREHALTFCSYDDVRQACPMHLPACLPASPIRCHDWARHSLIPLQERRCAAGMLPGLGCQDVVSSQS